MPRNLFYNQAEAGVVFDGDTVTKLADGDAIRILDESIGSQLTEGLKSAMTSLSSTKVAAFEMDLLPTSPMLGKIYNMWRRQKEGTGRLFDILVSTGVGEKHDLLRCAIEKAGNVPTGGQKGALRTVRCTVEEFNPDESQ